VGTARRITRPVSAVSSVSVASQRRTCVVMC